MRKKQIPLQQLLDGEYVRVHRLHKELHALSPVAHRHDHYELLFPTGGTGQHQIDFRPYQMQPGRIFFLHPGQVHAVSAFDRDGWIVMFGEELYSRFITIHRAEDDYGLLDPYGHQPYVDLNASQQQLFRFIIEAIRQEQDTSMLLHYVSLLLLQGNRLHVEQHPQQLLPAKEKHTMSRLKQLIGHYLLQEHAIGFYAEQLHLPVRQLNRICMQSTGLTLYGLLQERLLTESKILLRTSPLSAKEISHQLGFKDPAYFGRFFKKYMGMPPAMFRQQSVL